MMRKITTLIKATRKEAYEFLKAVHDGRQLTDRQKDMLLNYFAPPHPKISKDSFAWVAKACGIKGKEFREVLCVVHVYNGMATATDGHRIHWAPSDLPEGQYDPKTGLMLAEPIPRRPDLERVKGKLCEGREISLQDLPLIERSAASKAFPPVAQIDDSIGIDSSYLLSAINEKTLFGTAFVEGNLITGQSQFGMYSAMAVRMPRR